MAIRFFLHRSNYKIKEKRKIKTWIEKILTDHNKTVGEINIIVTSDDELKIINRKYLKRNNYTDIITFDYSLQNKIFGELYISIDRVKENAMIYGVTCFNELLRVIIHGILHLLRYNDIEEEEKIIMKKLEDRYLKNYCERYL